MRGAGVLAEGLRMGLPTPSPSLTAPTPPQHRPQRVLEWNCVPSKPVESGVLAAQAATMVEMGL